MSSSARRPGRELALVSRGGSPALATPVAAGPAIGDGGELDLAWPYRVARRAIWALPGYAVAYLWQASRPLPDPLADPVGWSSRVARSDYVWFQVVAGLGTALLGVVAVLALVTLLVATRARRLAAAGLLVALAAATLSLPRQGVASFAAPALAEQVRAGNLAAAQAYHQAYAPVEPLLSAGPVPLLGSVFLAGPVPLVGSVVVFGSILITLSWLLLAVAVGKCGYFPRSDALLLGGAAPLLGVASGYLDILAPVGALLLLAGGFSIAWSVRGAALGQSWRAATDH